MIAKCFEILSLEEGIINSHLIILFSLGNEPLLLTPKNKRVRRGWRSRCVHFSPSELVYAPLCSGPALLQGFASSELQAAGGLAATFCFLICVYLSSCPPTSCLPSYLLSWLKRSVSFLCPQKNSAGSFQHILFSAFAPPAQLLFLGSQITSELQCLVCSPAQGSRRGKSPSNSWVRDT